MSTAVFWLIVALPIAVCIGVAWGRALERAQRVIDQHTARVDPNVRSPR